MARRPKLVLSYTEERTEDGAHKLTVHGVCPFMVRHVNKEKALAIALRRAKELYRYGDIHATAIARGIPLPTDTHILVVHAVSLRPKSLPPEAELALAKQRAWLEKRHAQEDARRKAAIQARERFERRNRALAIAILRGKLPASTATELRAQPDIAAWLARLAEAPEAPLPAAELKRSQRRLEILAAEALKEAPAPPNTIAPDTRAAAIARNVQAPFELPPELMPPPPKPKNGGKGQAKWTGPEVPEDWATSHLLSQYEVHKNGTVRNRRTRRIVKPHINKMNIYPAFMMRDHKGKTIQKNAAIFILEAWYGLPEGETEFTVRPWFRDGNRDNLSLDNLEYSKRGVTIIDKKECPTCGAPRSLWKPVPLSSTGKLLNHARASFYLKRKKR